MSRSFATRFSRSGPDHAAWTALAGVLAALLLWYGPPGTDLPAHLYQRTLFIHHGFTLWDNLWYGGRYAFITYSVLYYPLAALVGIKLLAVGTVVVAVLAFEAVVTHEWGSTGRWSSRAFAVCWAALVLSGAFPFMLGSACALLALWALQRGSRWLFVCFAALTLALSPVAFLLLAVVLVGAGVARRTETAAVVTIASILGVIGLFEAVLWRMFPSQGRYPFSAAELAAACVFCILGAALTWRVAEARILRGLFVVYLGACVVAYAVPSPVGENIARLRFAAIPIAVLALSLRDWRPRFACAVGLALAVSWNVTPLAASFVHGKDDPAAHASYWSPAIRFLEHHASASYRVEAVDTVGHWPAVYLARAGIPLARGWFRQDDFPQNRVLYSDMARSAYLGWLRRLGVRYVVLTDAPPDYSARGEARLLKSRHSGLRVVLRSPGTTIFAVPSPQPIIRGPGAAKVLALDQTHVRLRIERAGDYALAIGYSPYWRASAGCVERTSSGMMRLELSRRGVVRLAFVVDARSALSTVAGRDPGGCPDGG